MEGDEIAECDYGLIIDNSNQTETFLQKMEAYAQAMIQNQMISTSTLIKLWNGSSISEITRSVEEDEREQRESAMESAQAEREQRMQEAEIRMNLEQEKLRIEEESNIRDNETKLLIKQLDHLSKESTGDREPEITLKKEELLEKIRQYNENLALSKEKFQEEKKQNEKTHKLKQQELEIKKNTINKTKSTNK